jgi:hypothetical protein
MKRITSLIIALAMICICILPAHVAWANTNSVIVTIPTFKVSVNDQSIDSRKLKYPLVEYKGITYFPLTWQWCRELGLVSGYTQKDGLYLANYTAESQETLDSGGQQAFGAKYSAAIAGYPIYINGKQIDNSKEAYPLLNFRSITYFPLTYRFVVGEFGWDQSFNKSAGYKLYTVGSAIEPSPGTHYSDVNCCTFQSYQEYAIMEKVTEERSISTTADENGSYTDSYVGRTFTYYKLDYARDKLTQIASKETSDTPYDSGAIKGEDVSALFGSSGSILNYQGSKLLDLSADAGVGNSIDTLYAAKHSLNDREVYLLQVYFTQGDTSVPAPYTPCKFYAFIDKGDGILHPVKDWPTDQRLSAVYPFGANGVYLSSDSRIQGCARYSNSRGWISIVNDDLTETVLNDRWKDWNSLKAVGMDRTGNLYLLNTSFTDCDKFGVIGTVNPVNDGYYRLDLNGNTTKIYPYVQADQTYVTPSGEIYIDISGTNETLHLQTGTRIIPN